MFPFLMNTFDVLFNLVWVSSSGDVTKLDKKRDKD